MQAKQDDLERLLEAQGFDLKIINLNKQLAGLPHPARIMDARKKRQELAKKADQVQALKKESAKKLTRIADEDASLEKKQNGVQAAIDSVQGDYRNVEARTKELAGIAKRREKIAGDRADAESELAKISALEARIEAAIADVDRMEDQATAGYREQGAAIQEQMADLVAKRDALLAQCDAALVQDYRKIADRLGSIAIGCLEGDRCSVCRSSIEGGRLIDLRNQAPLGTCPSCTRLLIIE